jgi:DNA-binding protein HU-beta
MKTPAKKASKAPAKSKAAAKAKAPAKAAAKSATKSSTITLTQMAKDLAESHNVPRKQATVMLADFTDMISKHLKKGSKVRISGIGILQVRRRPARMGRNPATGEKIKIKASKKVAFRAAKELKEAI